MATGMLSSPSFHGCCSMRKNLWRACCGSHMACLKDGILVLLHYMLAELEYHAIYMFANARTKVMELPNTWESEFITCV